MAKLECELCGNFDAILGDLESAILGRSVSATKEDESDFADGDCRCAVRVYERYSYFGGNRVSMNVTLLKSGDRIFLTAITAGGSQAVFCKVNTVGENKFLRTITGALEPYVKRPHTD